MAGMTFWKRLLGGQADAQQPAAWLKTTQGARVMVVDDSATIRAVLGRMLEMDGYTVTKVADGETALASAREEPPALIFLDIVLPGINGFAVLRALRHDPRTRHIPIVMISGNQQATEQFYVQRFGADDFIRKPFGQSEVVRSVDGLVRDGRLPVREDVATPSTGEPTAQASDVSDLVAVDIPLDKPTDDSTDLAA